MVGQTDLNGLQRIEWLAGYLRTSSWFCRASCAFQVPCRGIGLVLDHCIDPPLQSFGGLDTFAPGGCQQVVNRLLDLTDSEVQVSQVSNQHFFVLVVQNI